MKDKSTVSIVIATYNSSKKLRAVLDSIRGQNYPQKNIEILLADGGSHDTTLEIARQYKCKVIENIRTEPIFGKYLAYKYAQGKYIMYLDHDEVLSNRTSITDKVKILETQKGVKIVLSSGYINPPGYSFISSYINDFGDPFSFFIYRLSKRYEFFLIQMKKLYENQKISGDYYLFNFETAKNLPIIELVAGASMFNLVEAKKNFPDVLKNANLIPHMFYMFVEKYPVIAILSNDPLIHYSSDTLQNYFNKIKWRIRNNIYFNKSLGKAGFEGRNKYQSGTARLKKFYYIPYAFSIIFPLCDCFMLSVTRRDLRYFIHLPLSLYTAYYITISYLLKFLGHRPVLRNYDNSKNVE